MRRVPPILKWPTFSAPKSADELEFRVALG
jgi:hypothetical protein